MRHGRLGPGAQARQHGKAGGQQHAAGPSQQAEGALRQRLGEKAEIQTGKSNPT